jgi:hypothetical protein
MKNKIKRYLSINFIIYIFGRFKIIRLIYKNINLVKKKFTGKHIECSKKNYLQLNINKQTALNKLKKDGFYEGLMLDNKTIDDLINLSNKSELTPCSSFSSNKIQQKFINFQDVNNFNKGNDKPCCLLNLINPDLKKLANDISRDQIILDIVGSYLGNINNIDVSVLWSSVCNASDEWREQEKQTVTFHYDVHDLNFVYVFFYLTECDKSSGAHQLIRGSHLNKKIFKHLIGSAKQKKEDLEQDYNTNDFVVVEGSAGYGFIEDTSCYHRALKPINKSRLCLQFRYH